MIEVRIFENYPTMDFTVGNITMNFSDELDGADYEFKQFYKLIELALNQHKTLVLTLTSDNCINSDNEKAKDER